MDLFNQDGHYLLVLLQHALFILLYYLNDICGLMILWTWLLFMVEVRASVRCSFVFDLFYLGGILGAFMTGLFSEKWVNPSGGYDGAFYGRPIQLWYQIAGILTAIGK